MVTPLVTRVWQVGEAPKIIFWALLTGVALFLVVNLSLPYEQDQGSKLAVIYKLQANGWSSIVQPPLHYNEGRQPLYYLLSYLLFPVLGGHPYGAMNMVSVIMGMFFMGAMAYALRKTFEVPHWVTWLVFISTPMFVLTFTFSNEVAVAMGFLAMALAFHVSPWHFGYVLSGIFFGLALWAFLPIAVLGPVLLGWVFLYPEDLPRKERIFRVLKVSAVFLVTAAIFWVIFIRTMPPAIVPVDNPVPFKYTAALLLYTSCPSVLLISVLTVVGYFPLRLRKAFFLLLALLPMFVFYGGTVSHKHLFMCFLAFVVPAAIAVAHSSLWLRGALLGSIGIWYLLSVSPFGVYGPVRGADIFLPTNDGPCPTGAYLGFYGNAKRGIYQEQYKDEIYGVERGVDAVIASGFGARLGGNFNRHFVYPYLYQLGKPEWQTRLQMGSIAGGPKEGRILVIRRSYLRSNYLSAEDNDQMDDWLESGKVRTVQIGDSAIFPAVIDMGNNVLEDTESELGQRILFARAYGNLSGMIETRLDSAAFSPLFWVPADQTKGIPVSPAYSDSQFSAYTKPVPGASIWRLRLPAVLLRYSDPAAANSMSKRTTSQGQL